MTATKQYIQQALKGKLPGSTAHYKMLPPNRVLKAAPGEKNRVKQSSVLLLLFEAENELQVCLIKRPQHMKHHAGQIALPGGRCEENETPLETALRETYEEIGIAENKIEILGQLSDFYIEVSCFEILPFVGWLSEPPEFVLNKDEVDRTILFPIKHFAPPHSSVQLETKTGKLDVPCVRFNDEIIWGATAMILAEFFDVLSPELIPIQNQNQ